MINCMAFDSLHRTSGEGPPTPEHRAEFDAHLAGCPSCVARLSNYVVVTETLRRLEPIESELPAAAPLPEALVQRILSARKAGSDARQGRRTG